MKRVGVVLFIAGYLGVLGYGLICHALSYNTAKHPGMYFIVWDMYCGWSAYETRQHVVAEGVSGTYYEVTPPPWGSITPHGGHERQTFDYFGTHIPRLAKNVLRQTQHEPIARLLVVEEAWPRKFNLPDHLWPLRYDEPKDPQSYYQLRCMMTADGQVLQEKPTWLARIANDCIMHNPRLQREIKQGREFYAVSPGLTRGTVTPASYELPVE